MTTSSEPGHRWRVGIPGPLLVVLVVVTAVLFIGRLERDDPRQIARQLRDVPNISIRPYDELRTILELHRTQITDHEEGGRGFAVQLVLSIREMDRRPNLTMDVSVDVERDRLTLFVEPER